LRRRPTRRRRAAAAWPILLLVFLVASVAGTKAFAHANLVSSEPADDAVLATAPKQFILTFNEAVTPLALQLTDPAGSALQLSNVIARDSSLVVQVPDPSAPGRSGNGTYVLSWRVVSADGHPTGGAVVFSIGKPSGERPRLGGQVSPSALIAIWMARVLMLAGFGFGIGGTFFHAWILPDRPAPGRAARIAGAMTVIGAAMSLLAVGLQGIDALAVPLFELWRPTVWQAGFATSLGWSAIIAALAFAFAWLALRNADAGRRKALSAAALIGVGLALAASGHASTARPLLTVPSVFLHGTAIAFWVGALVPLYFLVREKNRRAAGLALVRFGKIIPFALAVLAASGVLLAAVQLDHPSALWTTAYGQVLLLKCLALAGLFGLAALNRFVLTPAFARGASAGGARLSRSIGFETVLVVAILAVVGLWRFTPPPRALAAPAEAPLFAHIHSERAMASVTIEPGRAGPVRATIVLQNPQDDQLLEAREVALILSNPAAGIEPIERRAVRAGEGTWRVDGLTIPVAGRWKIEVAVLITDFEKALLDTSVEIKR
jgi:copper transport protein